MSYDRITFTTLKKNTTATKPIFAKIMPGRRLYVSNSHTEFHEKPTNGLVADMRLRRTDWKTGGRTDWCTQGGIFLLRKIVYKPGRRQDNTNIGCLENGNKFTFHTIHSWNTKCKLIFMCLRINYAIKRIWLIFYVHVHLGIIIDVTANLT
jgi:hypothetical protein